MIFAAQTAASVRDDDDAILAIAELTDLTEARVRNALAKADGRKRVGNLFDDD